MFDLFTKSKSVEEFLEEGAVIVDVRSKSEYQSGSLKKSINIPLNALDGNLKRIRKDKPVITVCASGMRSGSAKRLLKSKGYEVKNGGAWTNLIQYD